MKEEQINRELALRVRRVRQWRGMTQGTLAKRIKMARNTVTNMEAARKSILLWTLIKMAAALEMQPHIFLLPRTEWDAWCKAQGVSRDQ